MNNQADPPEHRATPTETNPPADPLAAPPSPPNHPQPDMVDRAVRRIGHFFLRPILLELGAIVLAILSVDSISERLSVSKGYVALVFLLVFVPLFATLRFGYTQIYVPLRATQTRAKWRAVFAFAFFDVCACALAGMLLIWGWTAGPRIIPGVGKLGDGFSWSLRAKAEGIIRVYEAMLNDCRLGDIALDSVRVDFAVVGTTGTRELYLYGQPASDFDKHSVLLDAILGVPAPPLDESHLRYLVEPWPSDGKRYDTKFKRHTIGVRSFFLASTSIPAERNRPLAVHQAFCSPGAMASVNDGFFLDLRQFPRLDGPLSINLYADRPVVIWVFAFDPRTERIDPEPVAVSFQQGLYPDSSQVSRGVRGGYGFVVPPRYHDRVLLVEYFRSKS